MFFLGAEDNSMVHDACPLVPVHLLLLSSLSISPTCW